MNWKTRYKVLEENLFADMVVMVGRYMEYKAKNPIWDEKKFIEYYNKKRDNIVARCVVQNYVINQAKNFYRDNNDLKDISYNKVKRVFRRNNLIRSFRLRNEQFYFWKYVMDYIIENNDNLLNIVLKEILKKCEFYGPNEDMMTPYSDCLQKILDWYYIRLKLNKETKDKYAKGEILTLYKQYNNFPKYKKECRAYMSSVLKI